MNQRSIIQWLAPSAALVAGPACATTYFTVEEVQQKLFPGQTLEALELQLDADEARQIRERSGVPVRDRQLRVWKTAGGEFLYIDRVIGKHEFITYALAVDAQGGVSGMEILDYRESYGGQVRNPRWRQQFVGKQHGSALQLDSDIVNLSGATMSCNSLTNGVRRLLATHALVQQRG